MKNDYFISIQNCFSSIGYARSLIIDTQRTQFYIVPKEVCDILDYKFGNNLIKIREGFENSELINEYIEFLIKNEIIFRTPLELKSFFPEVEKKFLSPSISEILIVDLSIKNYIKVESVVLKLNVKHLELRVKIDNLDNLIKTLDSLENSTLHSIQILITKYHCEKIDNKIEQYLKKINTYKRVLSILIEGLTKNDGNQDIKFNFDIDEVKIDRNMVVNMKFYMESLFYNPYYNNKLYITHNNEVYNTPKKRVKFGILEELLNFSKFDFKSFYNHSFNKPNHEVLGCSNCEFRFSCVNSLERDFNEKGELYNKQECNYNPYIAKWKGEEGYRTLAECGVISNYEGFTIDHDKIAAINEKLWGEE